MDAQTHWKYDEFYPHAQQMRKILDDHFSEAASNHKPFGERGIWNYWFIPTLYTYLRCEPQRLFPELYDNFMAYLRAFAARNFGMVSPTQPFLSMYVNGCGQNIHNDAHNGRLAFVFSLTKWKERHFLGGETFLYKAPQMYDQMFIPTGGWGFYDYVEPEFNRLALFDDRFPHAVNPIQGTMDPADARFVIHGHFEDPPTIPYVEGALKQADLLAQWQQIKDSVAGIFRSHGCNGFVSLELDVAPGGKAHEPQVKCMQLLPRERLAKDPSLCVDDARALLSSFAWPETDGNSKLVFCVSSGPIER